MNLGKTSTGAISGIEGIGTASQAASMGAQALAVAGNMLVAALASFAIQQGIKAIDNYVNAQQHMEEAAQEARNEFETEQSTLNGLNRELETTQSRMSELEGKKLTVIEQDEYDRLKDTNDELERQIKLQQIRTERAEKEARNQVVDTVSKKNTRTDTGGWNGKAYSNRGLVDAMLGTDGFDLTNYGVINPNYYEQNPGLAFDYENFVKLNKDSLGYLKGQMQQAEQAINEIMGDDGFDPESQAYKDAVAKRDSFESLYNEAYNVVLEYYNDLDDQIGSLSRIENARPGSKDEEFNNLIDTRDALGEFLVWADELDPTKQQVSDTILSKYAEEALKLKAAVEALGSVDTEYIKENFKDIFDAFIDKGWSPEEITQHINETYGAIESASTPDTSKATSVLSNLLSNTYTTSDGYEALNKAISEFNSNGIVSADTYQKMLDAGEDYTKFLEQTAEGYVINTDALNEYIESQTKFEKASAFEEIQRLFELMQTDPENADAYQSQIDALGAYVQSLDSATSALTRFQTAQKSENQDSNYRTATSAGEIINDVLNKKNSDTYGQIGTDDFKTAVGLMIGENWEKDYADNVDAAYKKANEVREKYFKQDKNKTQAENDARNIENWKNDLIEQGLATYDAKTEQFDLADGITVDGIAEKFGMAEDAVRSLFGLMESYGANLNWSTILSQDDINSIVEKKDFEVAKAALESFTKEAERVQGEIDSLDPGSATYESDLASKQAELESYKKAIEELQPVVDEYGNTSWEGLSNEEVYSKVMELQGVMDALKADGVPIDIRLEGQYEELRSLLEQLGIIQPLEVEPQPNVDAHGQEVVEDIPLKDAPHGGLNTALQNAGYDKISNTNNRQEVVTDVKLNDASTKQAAEELQNAFESISPEALASMSPAELIQTLGETQALIDTLKANDIEIGVELNGQYNEIISLCDQLVEAGELEISPFADGGYVLSDDYFNWTGPNWDEFSTQAQTAGATAGQSYMQSVADEMATFQTGNVDLFSRHLVDAAELVKAGWENAGEGIATVFSTTISDGDGERGVVLNLTPITPDGKPLTPNEFNSYVDELFGAGLSADAILNADKAENGGLGLVISAEDVVGDFDALEAASQQAAAQMDRLHELQDEYYLNNNEDLSLSNGPTMYDSGFDQYSNENPEAIVKAEMTPDGTSFVDDIQNEVDGEKVEVTAEFETDDSDIDPDVDGVDVPIAVDASDIAGQVDNAVPDTETVDIQTNEDISADTSSAESEILGLESAAQAPITKVINADVSSAMRSIASLDAAAGKGVTKTVTIKTVGSVQGFAKGTSDAPQTGLSLVDEKGAELIEHTSRGTFELGTNKGARFTTLDKGDVVHTASETKTIMSRLAKVGGFFRDGLNKGKALIGGAFATGVSGSMSMKRINDLLNSSNSSRAISNKTSGSSKSKSAAKKWKDTIDKLFDWVEVRLEHLQNITNEWILAASNAVGYIAKNKELDGALKAVNDQIDATVAGYERYMQQADKVAKYLGFSENTIRLIQQGEIDIKSYSKDTQDKIKAYQEWYNKAMDCVDALNDLREQEKELARQKLDNILDTYQWRINRLDAVVDIGDSRLDLKGATGIQIVEEDYADAIEATRKKVDELIESRQVFADEFANLVKQGYIVEGTEEWDEYLGKLEELDETIIDTQVDLQELVDASNNIKLTNLKYALRALEAAAKNRQQMMSLHDAQGLDASEEDYDDLIRNGMAQIKNLEAQNEELLKQQEGLDELSEKWQELQEQIESNNQAILDMKTSQEQWNDSVIDIQISKLEKYRDQLTKTNDQYQRQKDLQQAIEDLERARTQRTQRVFREGRMMPLYAAMRIETSEYIG